VRLFAIRQVSYRNQLFPRKGIDAALGSKDSPTDTRSADCSAIPEPATQWAYDIYPDPT